MRCISKLFLVLLLLSSVAIISCSRSPLSQPLAGHAFYPGLAASGYTEPTHFTISSDSLAQGETLTLSVKEDIIYKYYYVLINGIWQKQSFAESAATNSDWILSSASASLSTAQLPEGENYVIVYSCTKVDSGLSCHDNKWQIHAFQIVKVGMKEESSVIVPKPPECPSPLSQNELVPSTSSSIQQKPVTKQTYIDYLLRQPYYYSFNPPLKTSTDFHEFGFMGDPNKNVYLNAGGEFASNAPAWAMQGLAFAEYYKTKGESEKAKAYLQRVKYLLLGPGPWNNWGGTGDKNHVNDQFKQAFDNQLLDTGGNDGSLPIRRCWFVGVTKDNIPVVRTARDRSYQNCQDFTESDLSNWATQAGAQNPKMIQLEYKNPKGGWQDFFERTPEQIELVIRALEEAAKEDPDILTDEERSLLKDIVFRLGKTIRVWGYGEERNYYEPTLARYQYDPVHYPKPMASQLPPRKEYWRGGHHRAQGEGMMRRLAAARILNDPTATDQEKTQAKIWQHYADIVWNDWWPVRDTAYDQTTYTVLSWLSYVMRGAHILDDQDPAMTLFWDEANKSMKPFWDRYLNTITPDGVAFPISQYEGFTESEPVLLWMMELLAAETKDGRYRWVAQRIMNDLLYQESQGKLSMGVNGQWNHYAEGVALAYLFADESVKPVEPDPGSQSADGKKVFYLPYDKYYDIDKDLTAKYLGNYDDDLFKNYNDINSPNYDHGYQDNGFVVLKNQTGPSKFFFKSGNRPGDLTIMVETAARTADVHNPGGIAGIASHGSILAMSENPKTFTSLQNMLSVEDSSKTVMMIKNDNQDSNIWIDKCYMESKAPTFVDYKLATHARLKTDNYLCFPMTNEREFFFVKNRFMIVRDRAVSHFEKSFDGLLKEIWYTETVGAKGDNWADTYVEKPLLVKLPMANPRWNLLVYHSPKKGRELKQYPAPADLNWLPGLAPPMPQVVSYDQTKSVAPETPEVFTYLLLPHDPLEKADGLASSINFLVDTLDQTVIRFGPIDNPSEWVVLNEKGDNVKTTGLETDAKQLYLQIKDGKVARILAVEASYLVLDGKDIFKKDKRITVDGILPSTECL